MRRRSIIHRLGPAIAAAYLVVSHTSADEDGLPCPPATEPTLQLSADKAVEVAAFQVARTGQTPAQPTRASITAGRDALNVTFDCTDSAVLAAQEGRDNIKLWKDDSVYVWIDPDHAHEEKGGQIMIQVSAGGVVLDDRNGDPAFDIDGLAAKAGRTEDGWTVTLTIPFKGLGVETPKPGTVWGFNLMRMDQPGKVDFDNMISTTLAPLPDGDGSRFDCWGHLVFAEAGADAQAKAGREAIERVHQPRIDALGARYYRALLDEKARFAPLAARRRQWIERKPERIIGGYFAAWPPDLAIDKIRFSAYTHIFHAFLIFDKNGTINGHGEGLRKVPSPEFCRRAHKYGTKAILSVGGGGNENWGDGVGTGARLSSFAKRLIAIVREADYDGIDLDWEFPKDAAEGRQWADLVRALREGLDRLGAGKREYLLTAAVSEWGGRHLDPATIGACIDFLNVMTYDNTGETFGRLGNHAALPDMARQIAYWESRGIPREMLVFGLPWYSYLFHNFKRGEDISRRDGDRSVEPWINFSKLHALETGAGWRRSFDRGAQTVWLDAPDGTAFAPLDDPETIMRKSVWAIANGYRGVFCWHVSGDVLPDGSQPLQEAMAAAGRAMALGILDGKGADFPVLMRRMDAGVHHVVLRYRSGPELEVSRVACLSDGQEVAFDAHPGLVAEFPKGEIYRLVIPEPKKEADSSLVIRVQTSVPEPGATADVFLLSPLAQDSDGKTSSEP